MAVFQSAIALSMSFFEKNAEPAVVIAVRAGIQREGLIQVRDSEIVGPPGEMLCGAGGIRAGVLDFGVPFRSVR